MRVPVAVLLCLIASSVAGRQEIGPIKTAVAEFLKRESRGLPGQVNYSIGAVDQDNNLTPCDALGVSLPKGGRLWGRSSVVVRCQADPGWSIFVPVQVVVTADYLVSARPLKLGQTIADGDLAVRHGDLTELPDGVLTDAKQAIGRNMTRSVAAGHPLRSDSLQLPVAIQQGQGVKVITYGVGFQVSSEGRALNNAAVGRVVQVRLRNGQVVSGVARGEGIVEISH
jgi:flagella basal body P-ring formation protein FlgA